jgi:hypothetical protein
MRCEGAGTRRPMQVTVHSLVDATRKPNENIDAVIRHYKAINDELEAQLAVALRSGPGVTGLEAGSACGDLASRSTAASPLPVAGASIERDPLLCSVISVGIGPPDTLRVL